MISWMITIIKAGICGFLFFVGTQLIGTWADLPGFVQPVFPEGRYGPGGALSRWMISFGMGALLAYFAGRLSGSRITRWMILVFFGWSLYSIAPLFEMLLYSASSGATFTRMVMDLIAFLLAGAAAVWFFGKTHQEQKQTARSKTSYDTSQFLKTTWRPMVAFIAFPIIYLAFFEAVKPFVSEYYRLGLFDLTAPVGIQVIVAQLFRSLILMGACLPFIKFWRGSKWELWAALGFSLYLLVGGFPLLQATSYPYIFRVIHLLAFFGGSSVYAAFLVLLFFPRTTYAEINISIPAYMQFFQRPAADKRA